MSEIKCTTVEKIGIIGENNSGWTKELRLVSWNDREPKFDIRDWAPEDEKMGKGLTLTDDEARKLYELLGGYFSR